MVQYLPPYFAALSDATRRGVWNSWGDALDKVVDELHRKEKADGRRK